ncbi:MAG: DUF1846 domain-containing protein [Bacteroides sp.]|nr:DUF1846 domain-containing protein [Bacillota bacterium]MCM1394419.1 DUF1846 domain-containing protein [[Eubacterium] siraeum]MCM1455314.1 DUF1846 domain-containing protein [Bacteroides sp.]
MFKIGFDSDMYMRKQTEHILERINRFDKLYLEFGGKLFDDLHAARVLPGFDKGAKIKLLQKLRDKAELIICINANAIERNKIRADYGITYGSEVERMIDNISAMGIYINCVVITMFTDQQSAVAYKNRLENRGVKVYIHRPTKGYPHEIDTIVSDEGYGANPYIETSRPLVVLTAPGPGSGKLATCLSQLYHENKRGVQAGYAKFETFPIWNLPLNHPVNVAYEAATADLQDVNKVDNFHLDAYGEITVNYNRDIEVFPVVHSILEKITGKECIYKSPTDMGVNMAGYCIVDDAACQEASKQEVIRRYCKALCDLKLGAGNPDTVSRLEFLMSRLGINLADRAIVENARAKSRANNNKGAIALELPDGRIVTGKNSERMSAAAACIFNSVKVLAGMNDRQKLISPYVIGPILDLKTKILKENNNTLTLEEALLALSICAATDANAASAIEQLSQLENCEAHSTHILSKADENPLRKLGIRLTCDAEFLDDTLFIE